MLPPAARRPIWGARYRRLAAPRRTKKADVALAHTILTLVSHVLTSTEPYRDLGVNYVDERARHVVQRCRVRRLERLGSHAVLEPPAA